MSSLKDQFLVKVAPLDLGEALTAFRSHTFDVNKTVTPRMYFVEGINTDYARLRPVLAAVADLVEAAEHTQKIWMGTIECTDIFPMFDALNRLREVCL